MNAPNLTISSDGKSGVGGVEQGIGISVSRQLRLVPIPEPEPKIDTEQLEPGTDKD